MAANIASEFPTRVGISTTEPTERKIDTFDAEGPSAAQKAAEEAYKILCNSAGKFYKYKYNFLNKSANRPINMMLPQTSFEEDEPNVVIYRMEIYHDELLRKYQKFLESAPQVIVQYTLTVARKTFLDLTNDWLLFGPNQNKLLLDRRFKMVNEKFELAATTLFITEQRLKAKSLSLSKESYKDLKEDAFKAYNDVLEFCEGTPAQARLVTYKKAPRLPLWCLIVDLWNIIFSSDHEKEWWYYHDRDQLEDHFKNTVTTIKAKDFHEGMLRKPSLIHVKSS